MVRNLLPILFLLLPIACGAPIDLPAPDAAPDIVEYPDVSDAGSEMPAPPDAGFETNYGSSCSGPQDGCGNAWCFPNCSSFGVGSMGHLPM